MTTICTLPESTLWLVRDLSSLRVRVQRRVPIISSGRAARLREREQRERAERIRTRESLPPLPGQDQPSPREMGLLDLRGLRRRRNQNLSEAAQPSIQTELL